MTLLAYAQVELFWGPFCIRQRYIPVYRYFRRWTLDTCGAS